MGAGIGERLPQRGGPQPGEDGQLFLEAVKALAERGERDPVGGVLPVVPPGAEPELVIASPTGSSTPLRKVASGLLEPPAGGAPNCKIAPEKGSESCVTKA